MAITYKFYPKDSEGSSIPAVKKIDDGIITCVPFVSDNTDYQEYLEWKKSNTTAVDNSVTDWDVARNKRDRLLRSSDWTMTTGATVDQAQWSAYREKLRDIPQTYKGKATSEIVWPTTPSTKGPNS